MSHPFCSTPSCSPDSHWPQVGWASWNRKAIYIETRINDSVLHPQAAGEAIARWNDAVGVRFLLTPEQGEVRLTLFERNANEWPFSQWLVNGQIAGGYALNYDRGGNMLGGTPGQIARSEVYVNREAGWARYYNWVNVFAHEIGHAFGLADHPLDDINSVMSYQRQGRALMGPSAEDADGVAHIYGVTSLAVTPQELEGVEQIETLWWYDRYGREQRYNLGRRNRWRLWARTPDITDLEGLLPYERYRVRPKVKGAAFDLGYGRFINAVYPPDYHWMYL